MGYEMEIDKIEISKLRYESYPDRYKADVRLFFLDFAGNPAGQISLTCRATSPQRHKYSALADKLLDDARRQVAMMRQKTGQDLPTEIVVNKVVA